MINEKMIGMHTNLKKTTVKLKMSGEFFKFIFFHFSLLNLIISSTLKFPTSNDIQVIAIEQTTQTSTVIIITQRYIVNYY